jgi:phage-related protein
MAKDIGPKIGIEGEAQFKKEINQIIQQAKTLDAQMKAVAASFDDEADAVERNTKISKQLQKQIDVQREAVAKLTEMHQKYVDAYGEGDTKTLKWAESLAKAQTKLSTLENELKKSNQELDGFGEGADEATTEVKELGDETKKTSEDTSKFGEILKAALSKEAIMGSLNAIKDGMKAIGNAAISFGKEVVSAYADYEQLEGGVKKLFGDNDWEIVARNAQNAFKTAGLSANEYMETVTSFSASLISSLGKDTKQAADLADRAIRDMSDNANTFGTDISSIQSAYQGFAKGQFSMLDNLKLGYGGTKTEMERLILDAEKLNSTFKAERTTNGELALSFADIVKAIGIVQDDMKITGTTFNEAEGTISGSIDAMKSAFQNFLIGLGSNNADIDMLLNNIVVSFENVVNNIQPIIERLIDYIPGIIGAILPVLQSMAPELMRTAVGLFNGFVSAIISALPDLIPVAVEGIEMFTDTILDNLPTIIDAGFELIFALVKGLVKAIPDLLAQAPQILGKFTNEIINNLPNIIAAGGMILSALTKGLVQGMQGIFDAGHKIMDNIRSIFTGGNEAAHSWGADMIINFANGIISRAKEVWSAVKDVAQSIWDLLHFSEPDKGPLKDFSTYAPDMMKTFAKGITQNTRLVTNAAEAAASGISGAMSLTGGNSNSYNYGGFNIVINQQAGESSDQLIDRLMVKIQSRINDRRAVFAS